MPMPIHRILIVDDDETLRVLTARWLKRWGFDVDSARDGMEASQKVKRADETGCPFELVISDVDMPQMSGMELACWLKDRYPAISTLLVSGFTPESEMLGALRPDLDYCATKPVSMGDMRCLIDTLDEKRSIVLAPQKG